MLRSLSNRKIAAYTAALSLLMLAGTAHAAQPVGGPIGTIRGGVYQDFNGDGSCVDDYFGRRLPAPGIDIHFTADDESLILYSGSNGTYGLIPVTADEWQVWAAPDPNIWLVTSQNPLQVAVTDGASAVQTEVNFCVLRISGPELTPLPDSEAANSVLDLEAQRAIAQVVDPLVAKAIISRALLTNPPEPRPPDNIEETLETPVDENAIPAAEWLAYLNRFREIGGLGALVESEPLTYGSQWHSRYMVVNDVPIVHSEDAGNALFDPAGDRAAKRGNLFATTEVEADYTWAINFWISAPFHLTPVLDPGLGEVGYGQYNQDVGTFTMAAVLDARSGLGDVPAGVSYPLYFPGDGAATWVVRHNLYEWPDALASCPGYSRPSGPPLVLQLGDGDLTPRVNYHAVYEDDQLIESCVFDESTYSNPDANAQKFGREILDERDAVVVIPRRPLAVGKTYRVEVTAGGQPYSWSFTATSAP